MNKNPNELTIENSALVLIDHQPAILLLTPSMDQALLINNVAGLARTAKVLGVPVVLTTVGAEGERPCGSHTQRNQRGVPRDHADRPNVDACLVAPGGSRGCRSYGSQEADHGWNIHRGLSCSVRSCCSERRLRGLLRKRLLGR